MQHDTNTMNRILRLPDVIKRTGLKCSSIYAHEKAGKFPKRIILGARCVGWLESEIESWIATRIEASRKSVKNAQ